MNLLARLQRREAKLVEELAQLRYEIRLAGMGLQVRSLSRQRALRAGMSWTTCRHCNNTTRADVATCDWCDLPLKHVS